MNPIRNGLAAGLLAVLSLLCHPPVQAAGTLAAYADEGELTRALDRWRQDAQRRMEERRRMAPGSVPQPQPAAPVAMPAPAAAPAATAKAAAESNAAAPATADGITNVQTAGVDEGGIVKRAGDHLVVLRRGRLFTLRVGGDALAPVAMVDAYAPGSDSRGAWYDELLVSDSTVVVIGYSYARGGTEIGLFDLDRQGGLSYRATWHLRSFDYYSARNYASRLIGRKLVFYTPTLLSPWGPHPMQLMPGLRRWTGLTQPPDDPSWQRLLPATRIHRTDDDFDPMQPLALHTVTRCDLGAPEMRCESSAVLGPPGRVFYVSQGSVWVWTAGRAAGRAEAPSAVFRLPLDGSAPSGIKTVGVPIDQLSFLEEAGHLNVLLRATGAGEGMHGTRWLAGDTALLRLPLSRLGDGRDAAPRGDYRLLPVRGPLQNRYVGPWLLVGGRDDGAGGPSAWALRVDQPASPVQPLHAGHAVERIEGLGAHAVLVGPAGRDLVFSAVALDGQRADLAGRHVQPEARQGESRTHGFFYRPTGRDEGLLGLPVLQGGSPRGGGASASVVFLRERRLAFQGLGELRARGGPVDDACKASCVDWYGNARPIFLGERVFALMGYELVEGRIGGGPEGERIAERRRVDFGPRARQPDGGRPSPFSP